MIVMGQLQGSVDGNILKNATAVRKRSCCGLLVQHVELEIMGLRPGVGCTGELLWRDGRCCGA